MEALLQLVNCDLMTSEAGECLTCESVAVASGHAEDCPIGKAECLLSDLSAKSRPVPVPPPLNLRLIGDIQKGPTR